MGSFEGLDLTLRWRGRPRRFRYNAPVTTLGTGVLALLALDAGFAVVSLLPNQVAAIRMAGPSLLWWYGALVAPIAGVLIAVAAARSPGAPPDP